MSHICPSPPVLANSPTTAPRAPEYAPRDALDELATRAALGSRAAEQALFCRLRPLAIRQVRAEAFRRNIRLHAADVDDIAQDALLSFWHRDLRRFDAARGRLIGFLRCRVGWCLTEFVRTRTRGLSRYEDVAVEDGAVQAEGQAAHAQAARAPAAMAPDAEVRLQEATRERHLLALPGAVAEELARLEDRAAARAVWIYDVQGRPLGDVARSLDVHVSNASRARARGLYWLRMQLPARLAKAA